MWSFNFLLLWGALPGAEVREFIYVLSISEENNMVFDNILLAR